MSMIKGRWFRGAASAVFAASLFAAATPAHAEEEIVVEAKRTNPPTIPGYFQDTTWSYGHFVHMERSYTQSGADTIENFVVTTSPPTVEPEDVANGIQTSLNFFMGSWAAGVIGAPHFLVLLSGAAAAGAGIATVVLATQYALENADLAADAVMDTVWGSNWETQREVLP